MKKSSFAATIRGIVIGIVGIIILFCLIPLCKGLKYFFRNIFE